MPSANEIGISGFGGAVNAPGSESQTGNTFFGPTSTSLISHILNINETPYIIKAFNLATGAPDDTISVLMVTLSSTGVETTTPLILKTKPVTLTPTNNALVLDMSGMYRFQLNNFAARGTVLVVGHPTALSYWSYGLSEFVAT